MVSQSFPDGKIKILRIIARLNVGGAAIHVVNLTAGLDASRFEQLLIVGTESAGEGSMLDYAFAQGVKPLVIPEIFNAFSLSPRDVKALASLYQVMRRERPHIVDTHTARAGFLGRLAARLAGVPVIVHTYHGHVLHGYYGRAKSWLLRGMEQSLAHITDRIITVSDRVKDELVAYGVAKAEQIGVIPLGFDLAPFISARAHRGEFRREFGFAADVKLVGIVGRIFPIKNHGLFLTAAARIAAAEPAVRFVIVGDGILRPSLEQQARDLGIAERVFFTGWRSDLPRIYADLDVLVVSSDNEGTPVSAIEAMASDCPVAATRVGGLPDLIIDGENGLLVEPRNSEELSGAVLRLLHNPERARTMSQKATAMARERFSLRRLIADMDHLYTQLLEEKALRVPATRHVHARE